MASTNGTGAHASVLTPSRCVACDEEIPAEARFCGFCGAARTQSSPVQEVPAPVFPAPTTSAPTFGDTAPLPAASTEEIETDVEIEAAPTPRRKRRKLLAIAAVLLVIAGVGAGLLVFTGDDAPKYDLEGALVRTGAQVTDVWSQADRSSTLDQLTDSGDAALEASTTISKVEQRLDEVGNDDDRRAAESAVAAYIGSLQALGQLADLEAADVADWPAIGEAIEATVPALKKAEALLVERELPGAPELASDVTATAGRIDVAMASISEKLEGWAAEVQRIEADKAAQQKALDDYTVAFRAQMERYAGLRASLADMTVRWEEENSSFASAYSDLGAALAQRREVHAAMSALVPPSALVPAHTTIVSAVQDAATAVQSAITGVEEYQWDYYYTLRSTPGWQAFQRQGEQAANTYNGGVGAWDAAVAAEETRIAGITTPARPAV